MSDIEEAVSRFIGNIIIEGVKTTYDALKSAMRFLVIITAIICVSPTYAFSIDEGAFLKRFSEAFGKPVTVSYDDSFKQNGNLVLDNVHLVGAPLSPDTGLQRVIFSNIEEKPHGAFSIGGVFIPTLHYVYQNKTINAVNVTFGDVILPPNKGLYDQKIGFRYKTGHFDYLELLDSDKKRLALLENGSIRLQPSIRQNPTDFSIKIKKITVFVENFSEGSTRQDFISMGYKKAVGKLDIEGAYGGDQAMMELKRFRLVLDEGGVLNVALKMDGMTLDSLLTVATLQRQNQNNQIKTTQMWLGMLAQIQRYNFYGGTVRFDDQSFTKKLIIAEAKRTGVKGDALIEKWKNDLPGSLSFAKDTSFMKEAQKTIAEYLDNPKSLQISSTPMTRLPVIMLAISGKLDPKQLIRELNLAISTNN